MRDIFEIHPRAVSPRIAPAAFLVAIAVCVLACGATDPDDGSDGKEMRPIEVEAIQVVSEQFVYKVALTGQLEAEYSVLLKPEIEGVVEEIFGTEGQPVSKGFILFRLRDREQQARMDEAHAEERLAKDVYERTQRLSRSDISSLARDAEALAKLDVARAQVDLARIEFDRTRVRAPFDGVLGMRQVAPGTRLDEMDGLIKIEAIDKLQLIFTTVELGAALAQTGATIHVRVAAYPKERFPGTIFFISPTIDPATRRLVMKAWISNSDHRLKPGMFANVDVDLPPREGTMLLPDSAMVYDRHGIYVWRAGDEDRAEKVPVTIGQRQDGRVEILDGISPGDWVITAGTNKAMAGTTLKFARTSASSTPSDQPSPQSTLQSTPQPTPQPPPATAHEDHPTQVDEVGGES